MEGWTKIEGAAAYAGVSSRTFRNWFKEGLRHSRITRNTVLVKYSHIDEFLENYSVDHEAEAEKVNRIVEEVMNGFKR